MEETQWAGQSPPRPHLDYARPLGLSKRGEHSTGPAAALVRRWRRDRLGIASLHCCGDCPNAKAGRPRRLMISVESVMTRCVVASRWPVTPSRGSAALNLRCAASRRQGTWRPNYSNGGRACRRSQCQGSGTSWSIVWLAKSPSR